MVLSAQCYVSARRRAAARSRRFSVPAWMTAPSDTGRRHSMARRQTVSRVRENRSSEVEGGQGRARVPLP
jgi:hypothetical protein